MSAGLLLQEVAVALAVAASAMFIVAQRFPQVWRGLRIQLALPMLRGNLPHRMRALGQWIAPTPIAVEVSSCGSCDGCGPQSPPKY